MKQVPIEKLTGLSVQKNSFTVPMGSLEVADNCVMAQDNIISKCRGFRDHQQYQQTQVINSIFDYQSSIFSVSQNTLYRNNSTATTAKAKSFSGSTDIGVRKLAHGLRNNDLINDFTVTNSDDFVSAYASRQVAFYGTHVVTVTFPLNVATRLTNVTTITLARHGMETGDTINVTASTITTATGTKVITRTGVNTFTIPDSGSNGTGTVSFDMIDSFKISSNESAIASVTSAAAAASYRYYVVQGGVAVAVSSIKNSRSVKPSKNIYFTTDNGILKLEREDLPVLKSGVPPGLDIQGVFTGKNGPVTPNSQIAYRVLFGRRDANNVLVIGSPSSSVTMTNPLAAFDIGNGDLSYNATGHFVTVTHTHDFVQGDIVYISGLISTVSSGVLYTIPNGSPAIITSVSGTSTFTFSLDSFADVSNVNASLVTDVTALSYNYPQDVILTFSLPSELDSTDYIYQIYRTTASSGENASPIQDYRLLAEDNLTTQNIADGFIDYTDEIDQVLILSNPELYTNPSQEGEFQSNFRPPLVTDLEVFKNFLFACDVIDYRTFNLSLVAPNNITNADYITIAGSDYIFRGNATNEAVGNDRIISPATTTSYVEITQANHGFLVGDVINVIDYSGITGVSVGHQTILVVATNTFRFASGASGSGTVEYEGLNNVAGKRLVTLTAALDTASETLAEAIELTAFSIVKAINRNTSSVLYAQYVSGPDDSPGKMFFIAKNLSQTSFSLTASSTSAGEGFVPTLPTSGTNVRDDVNVKPNAVRISKYSEFEAFPLVNELLIGSSESPILRIKALRDSLIVIKSEGTYRINGDNPSNFVVTILDSTVKCIAINSVSTLNNSVYLLANQGLVQVTESSARIVSRDYIEPLLSSIIGISNISTLTFGVGYESERLYLLSTVKPNSSNVLANTVYTYNYLTDQFTNLVEEEVIFSVAHLSSIDDKMLYIPAAEQNLMTKERKEQNRVDFTGQDYISNAVKAQIGGATIISGSNSFQVTFEVEHGFAVGDLVTVSRTSSLLLAVLSGGTVDINGLRTIETVVDEFTVTILADNNASATAFGSMFIAESISELDVSATTISSLTSVTLTTLAPHNLTSGSSITINSLSSAIAAAFSSSDDLLGRRTVTVLSPTTFQIPANLAASASVTDTVNISDRKQTSKLVTLQVLSGVIPQALDAVVSNDKIYKINAVKKYSNTEFVATLQTKYKSLSTDVAFLHSGYKTILKFSPIHNGNINIVKAFSEFQAIFRNSSSCTSLTNYFTSDGFVSSKKNNWNYTVGTTKENIEFLSWGKGPWGQFPWGGSISILRNFFTGPAVIYRTAVPMECFFALYIQPVIEHRVAGESLELQNIALYVQPQTTRVSR